MPLDASWANLSERKSRLDLPFVRRLIKRITRRVDAAPLALPWTEDTSEQQTSVGIADASCVGSTEQLWRVQNSRRAIYRDLNDMDQEDGLIHTALDVIADCVTGYEATEVDSFEWELRKSSPQALAILEDLTARLNLGMEAWHITRQFVKFGSEYHEVVLDNRDRIVRFPSLPSYTIVPKTDDRGNQIPGWYQYPDAYLSSQRIEFEGWQIIDFVYGARRGHYGTGLMTSSRRCWKRLEQIHDGMAIARNLRAYDKFEHRVPVKPEWNETRQQTAVQNYKANMTKRKVLDSNGNYRMVNDPMTVETDIYLPEDGTGRGGVKLISSQNVQLANIADVEYHQKILLSATKVPRKFLNLGRGEKGVLTDGSLTAEDIQFARTLRNAQAVLRNGIVRLGSFALFLQGYDARDLGISIRMPKISTTDALQDAKISLNWAQTAQILGVLLGGLPRELLITHYMGLNEQQQEIIRKFIPEMPEPPEATALPAPNRGGRVRDRSTDSPSKETPPAQMVNPRDLAGAITHLQSSIEAALEERGYKFDLTERERYRANLETILDAAHVG